jgi:hypothetical protein
MMKNKTFNYINYIPMANVTSPSAHFLYLTQYTYSTTHSLDYVVQLT